MRHATPEPPVERIVANLRRANAVALRACEAGHHPFGAILVAADHDTVLMEQGNLDTVNHAESTLARAAFARFGPDALWETTLYTTFEPCAMCAATIYWANIGRVVYGATEERLLALTGSHPENPTLSLPCRDVFARGQKAIAVLGPFDTLAEELVAPHRAFWK
jgi:tRNA(Arg) A34 adenosine deaminase TadA